MNMDEKTKERKKANIYILMEQKKNPSKKKQKFYKLMFNNF